MVGPVGGFQQFPVSMATQPAAGEASRIDQNSKTPDENKVSRMREDPASGAGRAETETGRDQSKDVMIASKGLESGNGEQSPGSRRGSVIDITV